MRIGDRSPVVPSRWSCAGRRTGSSRWCEQSDARTHTDNTQHNTTNNTTIRHTRHTRAARGGRGGRPWSCCACGLYVCVPDVHCRSEVEFVWRRCDVHLHLQRPLQQLAGRFVQTLRLTNQINQPLITGVTATYNTTTTTHTQRTNIHNTTSEHTGRNSRQEALGGSLHRSLSSLLV